MKQAVVGLLAHVDAGKTTLAEAMLLAAGAIRTAGRVDRGDSHLDTDPMERERGITIFASQASLDWDGTHIMLLDAPGHVDFLQKQSAPSPLSTVRSSSWAPTTASKATPRHSGTCSGATKSPRSSS